MIDPFQQEERGEIKGNVRNNFYDSFYFFTILLHFIPFFPHLCSVPIFYSFGGFNL
jgi:hypothetical protein